MFDVGGSVELDVSIIAVEGAVDKSHFEEQISAIRRRRRMYFY